jgi:hypothetical protein
MYNAATERCSHIKTLAEKIGHGVLMINFQWTTEILEISVYCNIHSFFSSKYQSVMHFTRLVFIYDFD